MVLADGVYTGVGNVNVDFDGRILTLRSENGPSNCVIDCGEKEERGVYIVSGESHGTHVQGLTFTECLVAITVEEGSAPRISDCDFRDNYAAILSTESYPAISDCVFTGHEASAAVFLSEDSTASISDCLFADNAGAGIISRSGDSRITRSAFLRNGWVGLHCSRGRPTIANCLIAGNGPEDGGGIWCREAAVTVDNCTIANNRSRTVGAGIVAERGGFVIVRNSIVWRNGLVKHYRFGGAGGAAGSAGILVVTGSTVQVSYSDIEGGNRAAVVEEGSVLRWGLGNFDASPLFDGESGGRRDRSEASIAHYRLLPSSPGIDTGDPRYVAADEEMDLEGRPRVLLEGVDVGAFEAEGFADCNGSGFADGHDVAGGASLDCNANMVPDECELAAGTVGDCNDNGVPDDCDLRDAGDCNSNGIVDECEADADGDGVTDECDGCPFDPQKTDPGACGCGADEHDGDNDGVPDCVDACDGFDDLADCNKNGQADGCDVVEGASPDENANMIPDECEWPAAEAEGGRYIRITPFAAEGQVALLVTGDSESPVVSCVDMYVQPDGVLGLEPFFQSPDGWGTVHVVAAEIIPSEHGNSVVDTVSYDVWSDRGSPGFPVLSIPTRVEMWLWGDVDNDGIADHADVELLRFALQGVTQGATLEGLDLAPCKPDGVVNVSDVQFVLKAISGVSFSEELCPRPCE